ncbi:neuronal pentraxin-2-like [Saccoglossus kowalevskii]
MSETSICTWILIRIQSSGTILSYTNSVHSLKLVKSNDLEICVKHRCEPLRNSIIYGCFYHICIIWVAQDGHVELYNDGLLNTIIDVNEYHTLSSDGYLTVGNQMTTEESFHGEINSVNIWSRRLASSDMLQMADNCNTDWYGDIIAWRDFKIWNLHHVVIKDADNCGEQ